MRRGLSVGEGGSGEAGFELRVKGGRRSVSRERVPPGDPTPFVPPFSHQHPLVTVIILRKSSFESWFGSSSEGSILETSRNGRGGDGWKREGSTQSTRSSIPCGGWLRVREGVERG